MLEIIPINLTIQTVRDVGIFPTAYAQGGIQRVAICDIQRPSNCAGLLTDPVAQRMPSSTVANEFMPSQSPILSPKMRQFMENLNRATRRRNRQTGLLDQYAGPLGGQAGLWGAIGTNR